MAQRVEVVGYRPEWERLYQTESGILRDILQGQLISVHHIGSTAVPGLAAKPVIDILAVVKEIGAVDAYSAAFEAEGYECMGEFGIPGRRYFRKGGDWRTHQIHMFAQGSREEIRRHLAVRDYLRAHPAEAAAYGALKTRLAGQYPQDIEGYCDGKDAFVKRLERQALAWYAQTGRNP